MRRRVAYDALRSVMVVAVLLVVAFGVAAVQAARGSESSAAAQGQGSLELVAVPEASEGEVALDPDLDQLDETEGGAAEPAVITEGDLQRQMGFAASDQVRCADERWVLATFMIVAGTDPATLEFTAAGPGPRAVGAAMVQPLYSGDGPLAAIPLDADGLDGVPPFSFERFALDATTLMPEGRYTIGLACVLPSSEDPEVVPSAPWSVGPWWSTELAVHHDEERDPHVGLRWSVVPIEERTPVGGVPFTTEEQQTRSEDTSDEDDEPNGERGRDDKGDDDKDEDEKDEDGDDEDDKGDDEDDKGDDEDGDDKDDDDKDEDGDDKDDDDKDDDDKDDDDKDDDDKDDDGARAVGAILTPPTGNSATVFSIAPTVDGVSCAGPHRRGDVVLWHTFLAPSWVDPAWIRYDGNGPKTDDVTPLYSGGKRIVARPVDTGGALLEVPGAGYTMTAQSGDGLAEGSYWVGVACTVDGHTKSYWAAPVTVRSDPEAGGPGGWVYNVDASRGGLIQTFIFERPAGALILTQRCGVHNEIPAEPAVDSFPGFPFDLPPVPGTTDQVGRAPDIDLTTDTIVPDPLFDSYPEAGTNPTRCGVDLGTGEVVMTGSLAGRYFAADGIMNEITVLDSRTIDAGWTVTGSVSDFVSASDSFSGNHLGWTPVVSADSPPDGDGYDQTVTPGGIVLPGTGVESGLGLASGGGRTLATALPGEGLGLAVLDARVRLLAPVGIEAGVYEAVMTITVM